MRLLQHVGNLPRVHNIFVCNAYSRACVGRFRRFTGSDAKGFESRSDVWILEPFGLVGYAFEVEYEPGCPRLSVFFRPSVRVREVVCDELFHGFGEKQWRGSLVGMS